MGKILFYKEDRNTLITKDTYFKKTTLTKQHVPCYQRKDNMYKRCYVCGL